MAVYAHLTEHNGANLLLAAAAVEGELRPSRQWKLRARASGDRSALAELAELVADGELITFGPSALRGASGPRPSQQARALQARAIDLRQLAFLAWPTAPAPGLADICERLSGPSSAADGNPLQDLFALHKALVQSLAALDPSLLHDLHRRLLTLKWPGAAVLKRAIGSGRPERVGPLVYASLLPTRERKRSRTAPSSPPVVDPEAIARALSPDGAISRAHPGYEHRPGQIRMAEAVSTAFNQDELLAVEGGAGTGKSLAYLLPAVQWAVAGSRPVVVSTNTRNLQDQLATKDIPLLRDALERPFAAAVAKGRSNYACLRKVMARAADAEGSLFFEDAFPAAYLLRWLTESPTGELSTIPADAASSIEGLSDLVSDVRSQGESCIGYECPWRPNCPVERMRRRAENADIIIANHALVFADAAVQTLPDYDRLILDEAHNVEDVATDQFGLEVSRPGIMRLLRFLRGAADSGARGPLARGGLLGVIARRIEAAGGAEGAAQLDDLIALCRSTADEVHDGLVVLTDGLAGLAPRGAGRSDGAARWTLRLTGRIRESSPWQVVQGQAETWLRAGEDLAAQLADIADALGEIPPGRVEDQEGLQKDVQAHACQWSEAFGALTAIIAGEVGEYVTWLEAGESRGRPFWALRRAPIYVGGQLAETLYGPKKTVVFTSATLTVDGEFHYLRQRLGLDAHRHRLAELTVPSPFHYREQLLLSIPTDTPLPGEYGYLEALCDAIADIAERARGGTLVLFTAYSTMMAVHHELLPRMRKLKLDLLCQELSGERTALLEQLRRNRGTVLFGVKSFWEGVDVPGEALRCLVITKLPFAVPTDPIIEARREHLEDQDIDSQNAYYIPQAILGLRQGLGRLIRTRADRGVTFVLDRRLLVRAYGGRFLNSIERGSLLREPLAACLDSAEDWLRRGSREPAEGRTPRGG